jgi:hypothetical protein
MGKLVVRVCAANDPSKLMAPINPTIKTAESLGKGNLKIDMFGFSFG